MLTRSIADRSGSCVELSRMGWSALGKDGLRDYLAACRAAAPPLWWQPSQAGMPPSVVTLAQSRNLAFAFDRYRELTGLKLREAEAAVRVVFEPTR
jgi:hypothetical protein